MKCSVVMPAYNSAPYIEEAVASVLAQTLDDLQLIVIDDGSPDDSYDRVASIKDPRIELYRQANTGATLARNNGLAHVRGEHVMFLDADDRLRPDALMRLSTALDSLPATAVAYGMAARMDERGRRRGLWHRPIGTPKPSGRVLRALLLGNFIRCPGAALVRTSYFVKTDAFRPVAVPTNDWDLWCRLAALGEFAYVDHEPVVDYRYHSGSESTRISQDISRALRVVDVIYSNPEVTRHFSPAELSVMRPKSEATVCAWLANECLRVREMSRARSLYLESLKRSKPNLQVAVFSLFSFLRIRPPWF